jgi:chromosome segregation ATPase
VVEFPVEARQEGEDRKNEFIITDLEENIKNIEGLLKEKDTRIESVEANFAEARLLNKKKGNQITELNERLEHLSNEFEKAKSTFRDDINHLDHEAKDLKMKVKTEAAKNTRLSEALKNLHDTCFDFVTQCSSRLR